MNGDRMAVRIYRALLRVYPSEFRNKFGDDMALLLQDQLADDPAWQVAPRLVIDLAITIPSQHLEAHMNQPSTHIVPLFYTALAVGGVLLAVVGGSNVALITIGLCVALIAGTTAAIAWRRSEPVGARISTQGWWKLVAAGPCIILGVIIASGLGVDAWMAGMFAVLVACVITGTGVLLGIAHFAKRNSRAIPT